MQNLLKTKKLINIMFFITYLSYVAALTAVYFAIGGPAAIVAAFLLFVIECTIVWELRRELKEINYLIKLERICS